MGFNKATGDAVSAAEWNAYLAAAGLYAASSTGSDAYAITVSPVPNDYDAGDCYAFKADVANTGAATLNVNTLGVKTIKKNGGTADLVTGDIVAGQIVVVQYDGTYFQLISGPNLASAQPVVRILTANSELGGSSTQFDITNPAGTTFRYTYDGNGTDPVINSGTVPIGSYVDVQANGFAAGNKGAFVTTGVGSNYFEVTNASGVVESNKTIGIGNIEIGAVWTKPAGLKYITIEVQGGGGGTDYFASFGSSENAGAGGYAKSLIAESALSATEKYIVGVKGRHGTSGVGASKGGRSIFKSIIATGGLPDSTAGDASGGDINIAGGDGIGHSASGSGSLTTGNGGNSMLGRGARVSNATKSNGYGAGAAATVANSDGADGQNGVIILTEYYLA